MSLNPEAIQAIEVRASVRPFLYLVAHAFFVKNLRSRLVCPIVNLCDGWVYGWFSGVSVNFLPHGVLAQVKLGSDRLAEQGFGPLKGKRVGLLTNPSGINPRGRTTIAAAPGAPSESGGSVWC